jgi:hypothetical protein
MSRIAQILTRHNLTAPRDGYDLICVMESYARLHRVSFDAVVDGAIFNPNQAELFIRVMRNRQKGA